MVRALMRLLQDFERAVEPSRADWADGGAAYADWVLAEVAAHDGALLIAESAGGAAIGVLSCWRAADETDIVVVPEARVHLYVSDLVVLPDWRGRGVAGSLLAEAERHGRALGLTQMTVGVLAANATARHAYAKAGFEDYEMLLRKKL